METTRVQFYDVFSPFQKKHQIEVDSNSFSLSRNTIYTACTINQDAVLQRTFYEPVPEKNFFGHWGLGRLL